MSQRPQSKLHEIFYTCYLWPRLSPPVTTVQYVMYFRFVDDVTFGYNGSRDAWLIGRILRVTYQGAESRKKCDVYDYLV